MIMNMQNEIIDELLKDAVGGEALQSLSEDELNQLRQASSLEEVESFLVEHDIQLSENSHKNILRKPKPCATVAACNVYSDQYNYNKY